jgi:putative proteasome-type protease
VSAFYWKKAWFSPRTPALTLAWTILNTTPYCQTGEAKYGKPIIDRVTTPGTRLADAAKCVLVCFDSTMRSNLSVGMPIDLACYQKDSLQIPMGRRFDEGGTYFTALSRQRSAGVCDVFSRLPELDLET